MKTPYTRDDLLSAVEAGRTFDYLYFWGHRPEADGSIGPSCCSQWFTVSFEVGGVSYASAEHFMMAEKARLFGDIEMIKRILMTPTANEAKALGRKVAGFDATEWEAHSFNIVVRGNEAKFSQNPRLRAWLIKTEPSILVESSPVDPIWGIGLHRDDPRAQDPKEWNGSNLLGFALTKVRDLLQAPTKKM